MRGCVQAMGYNGSYNKSSNWLATIMLIPQSDQDQVWGHRVVNAKRAWSGILGLDGGINKLQLTS